VLVYDLHQLRQLLGHGLVAGPLGVVRVQQQLRVTS
jgi:hypothetical protein